MDMLLTTGEQVSISLLTMAFKALGQKAISLTGALAGVKLILFTQKVKSKISNLNVFLKN